MASAAYDAVNKAWKATCRVLFGQEAGDISDCAEWLAEYEDRVRNEKSSVSGKDVTLSQNDYSKTARFRAFDEVDFGAKFQPLSINDMKDIDSVIEALGERVYFTGNVILGNSSNVADSSSVAESHFVLGSTMVFDSKYVAYAQYVRRCDHVFGMMGSDKNIHAAKSTGAEMTRCFECHMVEALFDCYYCAKVQNCHDCMFCFGAENDSYLIGNTKLLKEKYLALKKKLVSEIAEHIRKNGRVFSILELLQKAGEYRPDSRLKFAKEMEVPTSLEPVEKAFSQTTGLLLGKKLSGIEDYAGYLSKHVPMNEIHPSALSGSRTISCGYRVHMLKLHDFSKRMATDDELRGIGKVGVGEGALGRLSVDAETAANVLHPVAYMNLDKVAGQAINLRDCSVVINAQDCYCGSAFTWCKKCAYCFWSSVSEQVFGSACVFDSSFCVKCFYSKKMTRAFECDGCESCSDAYFSHNCENVRDSMFCFNAKNLTYAIGNGVLEQDKYKEIKAALIAQLAGELEKRKDLRWDIFGIGSKR
jgi:hypothetical protein